MRSSACASCYVLLVLSLGASLSSTCMAQTWTQVQPKNSPSARWEHCMSFDVITGRAIVFGGRTSAWLGDTWEYDGNDWTQHNPTTSPPARYLSEMVFVQPRLRSLMFGGVGTNSVRLNDTWVWSSLQKTWTNVSPTSSPPARWNPAMAYDSARDRVVMFGGSGNTNFLADTWEWDGKAWTQIQTANSPSARYSAMAYDAARKRCVLYGGSSNTYDTWEYDGKNWTQINTPSRPSARCCVAIEYDPNRQCIVVFGGYSPNNNETWEYDGNTWTQIKTTTAPVARYDFDNMVYDTRRRRMVLFGGFTNSGVIGDTWEFVATQALTATPPTISIASGGTQTFTLNAGTQHGQRLYWLFGSVTGTSPGVPLVSAAGTVTIPLVPDFYTNITIALPNVSFLVKTKGALDGSGLGQASLVVPKINDQNAIGVRLYHAYLVYDTSNNFYLASNPVSLQLVQ